MRKGTGATPAHVRPERRAAVRNAGPFGAPPRTGPGRPPEASPSSDPSRRPTDRDRDLVAWQLLSRLGARRVLLPGATLPGTALAAGDDGPGGLVLVESGAVKIVGIAENGTAITIAARVAGTIVSDLGGRPLPNCHRSVAMVALLRATIVTVSAARLVAAAQDRPWLALSLMENISAQAFEAHHRLIGYASYDAPTRVRRTLLELTELFDDGSAVSTVPLVQQDLADLSGVSREVTAKVLRRLRDLDAVRTGRSRIEVIRPDLIATDT